MPKGLNLISLVFCIFIEPIPKFKLFFRLKPQCFCHAYYKRKHTRRIKAGLAANIILKMKIRLNRLQQVKNNIMRGEKMKFEIKEQPYKTVFFWLSSEEGKDKNFLNSLNSSLNEWKSKKYLPVIFESGEGNIEDSIYMLMKHNFEILAKKDIT